MTVAESVESPRREDQSAGQPLRRVRVAEQGWGSPASDPADLGKAQLGGRGGGGGLVRANVFTRSGLQQVTEDALDCPGVLA